MSIEYATFWFTVLNSTVLAGLFIYLKFGIEKKLKKYEYFVGDIGELNTKIHDRLVEIASLIEHFEPISSELEKRLMMNAARLEKYDPNISTAIKLLIKTWNDSFLAGTDTPVVKLGDRDGVSKKCYGLIDEIKSKVDKLVK